MLPSDFSKKPIAAGLLLALYGATALAQDAAVDAGEATSSEEALEEVARNRHPLQHQAVHGPQAV